MDGGCCCCCCFSCCCCWGWWLWKGTTAHLAWLSFWPEASPKRWREERREWTVAGVQAASSAVVSSAYCTAGTRSPPTAMPRSGLERSQHERAQPTKRYMAGARGQPCLTPASHCIGWEMWPLTTAVAQVSVRRIFAQSSMPSPAPTASMIPKRKGRETVS